MHTIFKFQKYQKIKICIFIVVLFIIGCPRLLPPETVDYVNVCRYTGLWYQIASYINPNIGDLAGVTAEYSINQDCTVKVVNKGFVGGLDGTPVMIEGVARVVEPATNAKLAVSFPDFGITEESEYWIIELGEYYSYAVVTNSERSSLFILNRRPTMDEETYQGIIDRLSKNGFDPEQIVKTVQIEDNEMPSPETVESVDLESYAGLWYEYARYDTIFDEDAEEVTAEYTLNDDGTVKVVNRGVRPDGTPTFIEGVARVLDPETNAKLGVTFDRTFGHMIMVGLGGIYVEVLKDVAFRIVPVMRRDAYAMVNELRTVGLLQGARGERPADIDALTSAIVNLSVLISDFPEILELDINPLMVMEHGAVALDGRIIFKRD